MAHGSPLAEWGGHPIGSGGVGGDVQECGVRCTEQYHKCRWVPQGAGVCASATQNVRLTRRARALDSTSPPPQGKAGGGGAGRPSTRFTPGPAIHPWMHIQTRNQPIIAPHSRKRHTLPCAASHIWG